MKSKGKSNINMEKILFGFYFKKRFISIRSIICILLLIITLIYLTLPYEYLINSGSPVLQDEINHYWLNFIGSSFTNAILILIPIIMTMDIVSGEFSNRTAMVLYSAVSRNKLFRSKILYLIVSLFIFLFILFFMIEIITLILINLTISADFLIVGFILIFINLLFYISFTFILSALTRNVIISFLIPFVYLNLGVVFEFLDMKLLSYSFFGNNIHEFFTNILISQEIIILNLPELCFSFIIFFGLPFFVFLLTFYEFKRVDIRIS